MNQKPLSSHTSVLLAGQLGQSLPSSKLIDSQQQPTGTALQTEQLLADAAPEQTAPPACQLAAGQQLAKTIQKH